MDLVEGLFGLFYPFITALIPVVFMGAAIVYGSLRRGYAPKIRSFVDMLLLFTIFMLLAMTFRLFVDAGVSGPAPAGSLQWLQALTLGIASVFFAAAGYTLKNLFGGEEK